MERLSSVVTYDENGGSGITCRTVGIRMGRPLGPGTRIPTLIGFHRMRSTVTSIRHRTTPRRYSSFITRRFDLEPPFGRTRKNGDLIAAL